MNIRTNGSDPTWRRRAALALATCVLAAGCPAAAQTAPATRPAAGAAEDANNVPLTGSVHVTAFEFQGNRRFTTEQLRKETADILARHNGDLTFDDLEEARQRVTLLYVNAGLINSGAVLPDQTIEPAAGVVRFDVVEGKLNDIRINGRPRLRRGFVVDRIWPDPDAPLDALRLKNNLEIFRQNPNVKGVNAELKPGERPGESVLEVDLTEATRWSVGLQFDNNRSPSVGAERFSLIASDSNVLGFSDSLALRYGINKGSLDDPEFAELDDVSLSYTIPITRFDTTLNISFENSDSPVVEEPFTELNIRSRTQSYTIGLRQPLYRTVNTEIAASVSLVRRDNKSFLAGEPFSFSPGTVNGQSTITALRVGQEYLTRTQDYALALRSTFSFGLDILDATTHGGRGDGAGGAPGGGAAAVNENGLPDGQYWAWLGQAQYVRRLPRDWQLIVRGTAQFTDQALLPLEQFSLGGVDTVRGYRENQLVRDQAVAATIEVRIPILKQNERNVLDLALFTDAGWAKNNRIPLTDTPTPREEFISSAGAGLLWNPVRNFSATVYYGYPFKRFDQTDRDLQDMGIHFSLIATLP